MPKATKLDRVVNSLEGLPSIKSRDPLIKWLYEKSCDKLNVISPLPLNQWPYDNVMS